MSSVVPVVAVTVSLLALCVSALGFYWQWLRVGKVRLLLGPDVRVDIDDHGLPRLLVQVVLMNDGARSVGIVEMTGALVAAEGDDRADLRWVSFHRATRFVPGSGGEPPGTPWDYDGRAQPITVEARSSLVKNVLFVCHGSFRLTSGEHQIELVATGGDRLRTVARFHDTVTVPSGVDVGSLSTLGGTSSNVLVLRRAGAR